MRQAEEQILSSNVKKRQKMSKRIIYATVILLMVFSILACEVTFTGISGATKTIRGSGEMIEESRSVGGISDVELAMQGNLSIELGSSVNVFYIGNLKVDVTTTPSGKMVRMDE
jgi:hypothetical protein